MASLRGNDSRRGSAAWPAYAACIWAFAFAAISFYWAVGGAIGIETQAPGIKELAAERPSWFVAVLWLTGGFKVGVGLLALALAPPRRWMLPRWPLLVVAWSAGVVMTLWGSLNLIVGVVVSGLRAAGIVETPDSAYTAAILWHLLLWDPVWLLGGLLLIAATWRHQRDSRSRSENSPETEPRPATR